MRELLNQADNSTNWPSAVHMQLLMCSLSVASYVENVPMSLGTLQWGHSGSI